MCRVVIYAASEPGSQAAAGFDPDRDWDVIGLGAALGVSRVLANFLLRVEPRETVVFGIVGAVVIAVGLLASGSPRRRRVRSTQ